MQKRNLRHLKDKNVWVKVYGKVEYYGVLVGEDFNLIYLKLQRVRTGRFERDVSVTNIMLPKTTIDDILLDCSNKCSWWLKNGV
jgi:small nuclear ribonucleoprotein (snRNP)-like protein